MIDKFIHYRKFKEYFSFEFENIFAYSGTIIVVLASIYFKVYNDLQNYIEVFNTLLSTLIGVFLGMLALIFSGIVFWGTLFDGKFTKDIIRYSKDEKVIDKLYTSYLFLAFNIIGNIVVSFLLILAINSNLDKVKFFVFLIIEILFVYWFLFILGYIVAIMRNCIDLIEIKNKDQKSIGKKTLYEIANELRIDIVFELLYRNASDKETHDDLIQILNNRIDLMDKTDEEKQELKLYFEDYYKIESEEKNR